MNNEDYSLDEYYFDFFSNYTDDELEEFEFFDNE